jgi:hypothetical protein
MAVVGQVDLGALVAELAERAKARSEADVQAGIRSLLLYGDLNLDDPKVRLETPAPDADRLTSRPRDRMLLLSRHGQARVHPFYAHYRDALELSAKLAKLCLDAGVAEREIRLREEEARLIAEAFERAINEAGLDAGEQRATRIAMAKHLRLIQGGRA